MSLTPKQAELLTFIDGYMKKHHGIAPSFVEMVAALGLKSNNGPHRLLNALEERGFIRRIPHRARAIEVLRFPGEAPRSESVGDELARLRKALTEIASGDGYYGAQAYEYKIIARKALGMPT